MNSQARFSVQQLTRVALLLALTLSVQYLRLPCLLYTSRCV